MRKFVSIILFLVIAITPIISIATDYTTLSDEELKIQLDAIRNELFTRGLRAEKKTVILDRDGIQIYLSDDANINKRYDWDTDYCLFIPIVVVNDTSHNINMIIESPSVNGWSVSSSTDVSAVPVGKKAKGNLIFALKDAEVEQFSDLTDAEFSLRVYDDNSWDDLFTTEPITLNWNN